MFFCLSFARLFFFVHFSVSDTEEVVFRAEIVISTLKCVDQNSVSMTYLLKYKSDGAVGAPTQFYTK